MKRILCLSMLLLGVACSEDGGKESEIPTTATPTVTEPGGTATATATATPTGTETEGTPTKTVGPTPTMTPTPTVEPTPTESFYYYSEIVEKNGEVIAEYGNEDRENAILYLEYDQVGYTGHKFGIALTNILDFPQGLYDCDYFGGIDHNSIIINYMPEDGSNPVRMCTEEVEGTVFVVSSFPNFEIEVNIVATGVYEDFMSGEVVTVRALVRTDTEVSEPF